MNPTPPSDKHPTKRIGDAELRQQIRELYGVKKSRYINFEPRLEQLMSLVQAYCDQREQDAEKRLIAWAFQAEAKTGPEFATGPLAVVHRLVERLKEIDPEFFKAMDSSLTNQEERTK